MTRGGRCRPSGGMHMDEKRFGQKISTLRRERDLTQEAFADRLGVTAQAVSKWENGRSLPETALLPDIARLLDCGIEELFDQSVLTILEARFGDGYETVSVSKRINRLIDADRLDVVVCDPVLGVTATNERVPYLLVKYQSLEGIGYVACKDGERLVLTASSPSTKLPDDELEFLCGSYGTRSHHYDVMQKLKHYDTFAWKAYRANHETFPSDPANDGTEYLTLIYLNENGIHAATCDEGESLAYSDDRRRLLRVGKRREVFMPNVPELPPFGMGMECSWAAALTVALQSMGVKTTYDEVMGVSGACYRLAFCTPKWDFSSVDGLVAYDYATPGFTAFGYTPEQYCRVEKAERASHRQRIVRDIRNNMPVLGINLRVAPEWGVICGYGNDGEDLYCRTKYDRRSIENDPTLATNNQFNYLPVNNWPFLLCYFTEHTRRPSEKENLYASLKVFVDGFAPSRPGGYHVGFEAYEAWAGDLRDPTFYASCDSEMLQRRFFVNQFCALALYDARKSAYAYLSASGKLVDVAHREPFAHVVSVFHSIMNRAAEVHKMVDTGRTLDAEQVSEFWTENLRAEQADILDEVCRMEHSAVQSAKALID